MDHKEVVKNIEKGIFEKIYFLHGEEPYFIDLITNSILEHALQEHERDFNQTIVYGKDTEVNSLIVEAKGYPMMSERRIVVLREAQDMKDLELLESYFEHPLESTIVVINYKYKNFDSRKKVFKAANKNGLVFKSEKIPEYKLADWVGIEVKSNGYGISPKAAMLLAEFLGNDLSKMVNELNKLYLLIEKGTMINEIHIEENIGISKDYNMFELSNAIAIRDIPKAFAIVDYFEHNPKAGPLILVINSLFSLFSNLMKIHFMENKSKDAVANSLKVHPFVATKHISSAQIYNPKKIASNIAVLYDYDLKSKGIGNSSSTDGQLMKEMVYQLMH